MVDEITPRAAVHARPEVTGQSMTVSTDTVTIIEGKRVYATGLQARVDLGDPERIDLSANIEVVGPGMVVDAGYPIVTGHVVVDEFAFPFDNPVGISGGLTKRQFYASQALIGFISNSIAANLIGNVAAYCFKVADSMVAEEEKGIPTPAVSAPIVPGIDQAIPPQVAPPTVDEQTVIALQEEEKQAEALKLARAH